LLSLRNVSPLYLAIIVGFGIIWSMYAAVLGTLFAESFSANVRYTGISLGYQVGAALVGGPAPLVATALLVAHNNNYVPVGIFIMGRRNALADRHRIRHRPDGRDLDDTAALQPRAEAVPH
jgi:hypothetical protein